jgi:hypothetical protein
MTPFEAVKSNVTARQAAEFYGFKADRHGMACCPFHNDKHPSMKVDKRFHCFGCGADGDAIDFVSKYFGLTLKDAAMKLCNDFGLSYNTGPYRPPARDKPKKSPEQIFKETATYCFDVLCDYLHLLKQWKTEYAPKDPYEEWHPYFCEALNEIDHIEYLLDLLLYGDISDRAFVISDYGRKVKEIERRIKYIKSRNA